MKMDLGFIKIHFLLQVEDLTHMVLILIVVEEWFVRVDTKPVVVNKQLKTQLSAYQLVVEKELKETENLDVDKCGGHDNAKWHCVI